MADNKELFDEVTTAEDINEVDGEPIYHDNEGEDEDEPEGEETAETESTESAETPAEE